MTIARRFTERAATAWVSLIATAMVTAGVMLAGMGVTLRQTAVDITGITVITSGLMVMGAALASTGAISGIANWRVSRDSGAPADVSSRRLKALVGAAAALPVILALLLTPLIAYWRDLVRLADQYDLLATANGPSALVFVPAAGVLLVPGLEAVAALTVAIHAGVVLLLTLTRSAAVLKLSAIGTVLVGGLCAGCWVGVVTTERLAPAVETLIRTTADANGQEQARMLDLVERHRMVCMSSAQSLSWGWIALAFIAFGMRAGAHPRTRPSDNTQSPQPLSMHGMDELAREKALLDAADRLHRNTPPRVSRFGPIRATD
jgi:hypothetical protein